MKKYRNIIGGVLCVITIVAGIILWNMTNKNLTDEWIYYSFLEGKGDLDLSGKERKSGLWRIQKESGKQELIWDGSGEGSYVAFFVTEDNIYAQKLFEGIYRMDLDGSNLTPVYKGTVNAYQLRYQDDWLYFSNSLDKKEQSYKGDSYLRLHTKTGELDSFLPDRCTITKTPYSSFVVDGDSFYTITALDGQMGILHYNLNTKIQKQYSFSELSLPDWKEKNEMSFELEDCGEYILLICLDYRASGHMMGIYAAKKGSAISEETVWKEVRFPDMLPGTAAPPHCLPAEGGYAIVGGERSGYIFHDNFAYYLNEDWKLCSRPLFGKPEEVTVYEETSLAVDSEGRFRDMSCCLSFGKRNFYYRYYTKIDEENAVNNAGNENYRPIPTEWRGYIGNIPRLKK
jgi:hypothetical protein